MKENNIAILICTYDGAKDLWKPLHQTYEKYWSDCPYNIYLTTNNETPSLKPFTPLHIGEERSWSDNIYKSLNSIEEPYILLTFDDLFLYEKIDSYEIKTLLNLAVTNKWEYLRLHPSPLPDNKILPNIGKIQPNRLYRTSTVLALFKKKVLLDLLDREESAWEFERNASLRSNKYEHFYCVTKTVLPYLNGVVKGKWVPSALEYLIEDGINISKADRPIMTKFEAYSEKLKRLRLRLFLKFIPVFMRMYIKKLLK